MYIVVQIIIMSRSMFKFDHVKYGLVNDNTLDSISMLVSAYNQREMYYKQINRNIQFDEQHIYLTRLLTSADAVLMNSLYNFLGRMNKQGIAPGSEYDPDVPQ